MNDHRPAPSDGGAAVSVRELSYRYPAGQQALAGISFTMRAGETVGVVGPSGAGKSTLLLHLNGLLPETADGDDSSVEIAGLPVVREHLKEVRRAVGMLFQNPDDQLFCATVAEDVAFGPLHLGLEDENVRGLVARSLAAVGLEGYGSRNPSQLSVGERKRVCLAGLLACEPSILALDEPFSNLDPRARRVVAGILRSFAGSLIIATHDLEMVAELCERAIVVDGGAIQADGPTGEILSDGPLMERHGLEVPWRYRCQ